MSCSFIHSKKLLLEPVKGSPWAEEMVLNPAVIQDEETGRIHMLFRATGPWPQKQIQGKPLPYPIFLGYGWSDNGGESWEFDLNQPALLPKMEYEIEKIYINNDKGHKVINYANGAIEDPRLFYFEGNCYMITACRMFPPGPYWEHDQPVQCAPGWVASEKNPFGAAASENYTVNVLWRVKLPKLAERKYEETFEYVVNLTNPLFGEDRDVLIFPERLPINGEKKIVMLQRPYHPDNYPAFQKGLLPSIVISSAETFEEFENPKLHREILAVPEFEWEKNKIGGSTPPIKVGNGEWLLNYHGKQDREVGYTQSFMILQEQTEGYPAVKHRCPQRLITADEGWEMPNKFTTPCVFITGLIKMKNVLLASYGAADEKVGTLKIDYEALIGFLRKF